MEPASSPTTAVGVSIPGRSWRAGERVSSCWRVRAAWYGMLRVEAGAHTAGELRLLHVVVSKSRHSASCRGCNFRAKRTRMPQSPRVVDTLLFRGTHSLALTVKCQFPSLPMTATSVSGVSLFSVIPPVESRCPARTLSSDSSPMW